MSLSVYARLVTSSPGRSPENSGWLLKEFIEDRPSYLENSISSLENGRGSFERLAGDYLEELGADDYGKGEKKSRNRKIQEGLERFLILIQVSPVGDKEIEKQLEQYSEELNARDKEVSKEEYISELEDILGPESSFF